MSIIFIQTADAFGYYDMISVSSQSVRTYCLKNGFFYEEYRGQFAQNMPWKSSYNRIPILKSLLDSGFDGWALYLDADAFIKDANFDLKNYLSERKHYSAIFSGYLHDVPSNINSGGFAINFGHINGREIVREYERNYLSVGKQKIDDALFWGYGIADDQEMLQCTLDNLIKAPHVASSILFEHWTDTKVNDGSFVGQALRSHHDNNFSRRVNYIRDSQQISTTEEFNIPFGYAVVANIHTSHPRIKTEAGSKDLGLVVADTSKLGCILHGPYVELPAGKYEFFVYGRTANADALECQCELDVDIVSRLGTRTLAKLESRSIPSGPFFLRVPFEVSEKEPNVELRIFSKMKTNLYFHRIILTRIQSGA